MIRKNYMHKLGSKHAVTDLSSPPTPTYAYLHRQAIIYNLYMRDFYTEIWIVPTIDFGHNTSAVFREQ